MQKSEMKVYIAAPFFKHEQINVVEQIENLLMDNYVEFHSPRSAGDLGKMDSDERVARMEEIFQSNVDQIDWCTHVVAVIDGYDTGTVWEMGYAYAKRKKIITYTDHYYGINVMLNESILGHCMAISEIWAALSVGFKGTKTEDVV